MILLILIRRKPQDQGTTAERAEGSRPSQGCGFISLTKSSDSEYAYLGKFKRARQDSNLQPLVPKVTSCDIVCSA